MRKRYELADPTSCLSKAADDEWLADRFDGGAA